MRIILIGIIIFTTGPLFIGCSTLYNVLRPIPKDVEPVVVSAAIVQANIALFEKGRFDLPAEVLFSTDPNISNTRLKELAHEIFKLKGTKQKDPDRRVLAKRVSDEAFRPYNFLKVPYSFAGSDNFYLVHIMIIRNNLSEGHLRDSLLKCLLLLNCSQGM